MNIITSLKLLTTISIIFVLLGCEQKQLIVPPITKTPTNNKLTGKIVWHDLLTDDVNSVKSFYGGLFGWKFDNGGDPEAIYTTILFNGNAIGGIIHLEKKDDETNYASQWMEYISVEDVDGVFQEVIKQNCKVFREPFDIMNRGRIAIFADTRGALIAVVNSSTGDPEDVEVEYNNWFWDELWTDDLNNSVAFYKSLFNYTLEEYKTRSDNDYVILRTKEKRRAGVLKIPFDDVKPNWLPFVAVKDVKDVENKVKELGGDILVASEGIIGNEAAIITDPSGAVFTIHNWPLSKEIMDKLNEKN
ncbi:MAG: VOC family protein [Bacteroidetes bacterium]|nr:VOC family protein [Bacteroidota bacterium]